MRIVHSILNPVEEPAKAPSQKPKSALEIHNAEFAREMAWKGWKKACKILAEEIKSVQVDLPEWTPDFVPEYKMSANG